jgi:glyoxylase-like metal-dependent hydrolase (beta-lactamase superfamily II)
MGDEEGAPDPASLEQGWFEVRAPEPGIFTIVEPLHSEEVKSNLIVGDERAMLIDTGMGVGDIRGVVERLTDRPVFVVNSHAHWDHIGGNWRFEEIWIHEAEADRLPRGVGNERLRRAFTPEQLSGPLPPGFDPSTATIPPSHPNGVLQGGEAFNLGGRTLEVIHCPGHSPGGIALLDSVAGVLFSTDVAYPCALYAFSSEADLEAYHRSLTRLALLTPVLRTVYPSHCASPMDPDLLLAMRDAVGEILGGRQPDRIDGEVAHHEYDGFSVLTDAKGDAG